MSAHSPRAALEYAWKYRVGSELADSVTMWRTSKSWREIADAISHCLRLEAANKLERGLLPMLVPTSQSLRLWYGPR